MSLQIVLARYIETKILLGSPKCVSVETLDRGGGKRRTMEDAYAFVVDCELAIKDMGKWGIIFQKYFSWYASGFNVPENNEHAIADKIAFHAFRKRNLL